MDLGLEKLVLEQHSFTFGPFAVRAPPIGLLLVLLALNSEKLVLQQYSFTVAHFYCLRPPAGLLPPAGAAASAEATTVGHRG